ncbi:MAG TPA: EamA family transporter [Nocardioidaceae bacterium]|nr:EamA family transporter [Nocardioidaceae bacterium]
MAELSPPAAADPGPVRGFGSAALVLGGAALFGTVGTAQLLGPDVPAPQLAAARLLLAAAVFVLVAVATRQVAGLVTGWRQPATWFAALGQAGFNLCFLGAMNQAGVAVGTLVAIGATPILTGLATRHVSRLWLVATCIAVGGLALLVGGQLRTESAPSTAGIVLALGASASYATYIIAGNAAASRGLELQSYLAVTFTIAAVLTFPLLLVGEVAWAWTGPGALLVVYLALVPTVLAYNLFNRGLHGVRPSTASTLGLIEPVVAALLAVLLVDERLSPAGVVGAVLIVTGLLLIVRSAGSRERVPVELG